MMKPGIPEFIVDSIEKAIKFYTEKLSFDIAGLSLDTKEKDVLDYALLRKGKCFVCFRAPDVQELADFSMTEHTSIRGAGMHIPMKKNLDKYFELCKKKSIQSISEISTKPWGQRVFSVRDPFGIRLTFAQSIQDFKSDKRLDFCGMQVEQSDTRTLEEMIQKTKNLGILRRFGKKFAKLWLKEKFGSNPT